MKTSLRSKAADQIENSDLGRYSGDHYPLDAQLKSSPIPKHVAVIMDGNGRWALNRGLSRIKGHEQGAQNIIQLLESCFQVGVSVVSLYSFSTENWKRPKQEINALFRLLEKFIKERLGEIKSKNIKIKVSGNIKTLPRKTQELIGYAMEETQTNERLIANFCFNYGARDEIHRAVNLVLKAQWENFKLLPNASSPPVIQPCEFEKYLYTNDLPDVDLVVRTAGEFRLSNFLLYQSAYAELYFTDTLWPDFNRSELIKSVLAFQNRERKFGGLGHE